MKLFGYAARALGALTLVAALSSCTPAAPVPVPSDEGVEPAVIVRVFDNAYEQADVSIAPGEAVQWVFEGHSAKHDVVADDGSFVSELMYEGTYTHVFDETGEFPYDCSIHPEMQGTVTVE